MKVVFAHDHIFRTGPPGRIFSDGKLPYRAWARYLESFDEIQVIGRGKPLASDQDCSLLSESSGPRVHFHLAPSSASLIGRLVAGRRARSIVNRAVLGSDAVIARLPSQIGRLAVQAAVRHGRPWSAEVVQCPTEALSNHGHPLARTYARWSSHALRRDMKRATHVTYVTSHILQNRYPTQAQQIACSNVEIPAVVNATLDARLTRIGRSSRPIVGLIGNLTPIKGIDTLIEAVSRISPPMRPNVRILGGGDPDPWQRIAEKYGISDLVSFDGILPHGLQVRAWLDDLDLYVQPSFAEGLPRALIEAMSRACPAIASTAGGSPELLDARYLHKPGDAERLTHLLEQTLLSPIELSRMARTNFDMARQYSAPILEARRRAFWKVFRAHVEGLVS